MAMTVDMAQIIMSDEAAFYSGNAQEFLKQTLCPIKKKESHKFFRLNITFNGAAGKSPTD